MEEVKRIANAVKKGDVSPIYLLTGEEAYFIDFIADYIEKNVLTEDEKAFNQVVLYGQDVTVDDIVNNAKRYPMMAEKQVVIIREAQELHRTIENLAPYAENPQPSTVLVLCYKYKKVDKRKKLYKAVKTNGVILESKTLYENKVGDWIERVLAAQGYKISPKASVMLVEFLGNDLSKIAKELEKLMQIVKKEEQITPLTIEKNIGISKDFNNFELQNAIGEKNIRKAFQIVNYFSQNPKNHPLPMTVALLYSFFSKIMKYHALTDKSKAPSVLGISPYFVKDYQLASKNYPMKKVSSVISKIREVDMKGKGVEAGTVSEGDLLKELLVEIFD